MALMHLDFESQFTGHNEDVYIIMPDKKRTETPKQFYGNGKKYPVLWLLHGTFGGYSDWIRKSNIELYACEHDLIVVMMGVGNSNYAAWNNFTLGYDAEKYLFEELMPLVYNWLPASDKREDNFIAGLSMGGGATFRFAVDYPDHFAAAAVLSSAPKNMDADKENLEKLYAMNPQDIVKDTALAKQFRTYNNMHRYNSVDEYLASSENTWRTFDRIVKEGKLDTLPRIMFGVGTEDPIAYKSVQEFRKHADEVGFKYEYHEGPGSHEWRVWDRDIQLALTFFGFGKEEQGNKF